MRPDVFSPKQALRLGDRFFPVVLSELCFVQSIVRRTYEGCQWQPSFYLETAFRLGQRERE